MPPGNYVCGTIELKSHVRLYLDAGAAILGSGDRADYRRLLEGNQSFDKIPIPVNHDEFLIVACRATNVSIAGPGTIDGRGHQFYEDAAPREIEEAQAEIGLSAKGFKVKSWRPGATVAFPFCRDIAVTEVSIVEHPFFALFLHGCKAARIDGLRIKCDWRFHNADGIHVAATRRLTIANCDISTEDDAICFYNNYWRLPESPADCAGIAVSNCVLSSACSGVRIGYAGEGELANMSFSNLVINRVNRGIDLNSTARNNDQLVNTPTGPSLRNIRFTIIVIHDADWGITGNLLPDAAPPACIRDIAYGNTQVDSRKGNYLVGSATNAVRDVLFRDVVFTVSGPMPAPILPVPDPVHLYNLKGMPYGFFLRHAEDVAFRDCRIRWEGVTRHWRSGLSVLNGKNVDCRALRVDKYPAARPETWGTGVTTQDAAAPLPQTG